MTKTKKYSLPYWVKHTLRYTSDPDPAIAAAVKLHFDSPEQSEILFEGTALELINAIYIERKKREAVYHCFFPTPLDAAAQLARFTEITAADMVFDAGAGFGNLMHGAQQLGAQAFGVEANYATVTHYPALTGLDIVRGDLLDGYTPTRKFTCVVTNPPFGRCHGIPDQARAFLHRIAEVSPKGTRVGAILPKQWVDKPASLANRLRIEARRALPSGTFKPLTPIETEMVLLHTL